MKTVRAILIVILGGMLACSGGESASPPPQKAANGNLVAAEAGNMPAPAASAGRGWEERYEPASIQPATSPLPDERKIIRNAELTLEVAAPTESQQDIASVADSLGGFVVTSEFRQSDSRAQSKPAQTVTVVFRIPAARFSEALGRVRQTGGRVLGEKVTGRDVTEEYVDLEARIRAKRALEAQFLEIMKRAAKVSDALEVQSELSGVRTEIEQLEGRRRYLDNQSEMSTITVSLQTPAPVVTSTATGFGDNINQAFGEGIDLAIAIVLGVIRALILFIPILLLVVLPVGLLLRTLIRRRPWFRRPRATAEQEF